MGKQTNFRYNGNGNTVYTNLQTDNYTLTANDNGKIVVITAGSGKTLTVPTLLPIGFNCLVVQGGSGAITIAGSGTTLRNADSQFNTGGIYAAVTLFSYIADEFVIAGKTA